MTFRHNKVNAAVMVYGFVDTKESYDMVMTLHLEGDNRAKVYGFMSKVRMELNDFVKLWRYVKKNVQARYLQFEVLTKHAAAYEMYLPVIKKWDSVTFTGYKSVTLLVDLWKRAKPLNGGV
jgi:CO dehydrogenase/acetyl-CoA synthase beta subunit